MSPYVLRAGLLAALLIPAACSTTGPTPQTAAERQMHGAFQRDRETCRRVAETRLAYVDPDNGDAVARRSMEVEAETQACLLARGWNDPDFDGWQAGRS